jgi:hypothetical protein
MTMTESSVKALGTTVNVDDWRNALNLWLQRRGFGIGVEATRQQWYRAFEVAHEVSEETGVPVKEIVSVVPRLYDQWLNEQTG